MPYVIYSLDSAKFRKLVERPTPEQVEVLAQILDEALDSERENLSPSDPVLQWGKARSLEEVVSERLALPDWYSDLSYWGKTIWEGVIFSACMGSEEFDVGFAVNCEGISWDLIEKPVKHLLKSRSLDSIALAKFGHTPYRFTLNFDEQEEDMLAVVQKLQDFMAQAAQDPVGFGNNFAKIVSADATLSDKQKKVMLAMWDEMNGTGEEEEDEEEQEDDDDWPPMHSMHPTAEVSQMLAELQSLEKPLRKKPALWEEYQESLKPALEEIVKAERILFVQVDT